MPAFQLNLRVPRSSRFLYVLPDFGKHALSSVDIRRHLLPPSEVINLPKILNRRELSGGICCFVLDHRPQAIFDEASLGFVAKEEFHESLSDVANAVLVDILVD